MFTNIPVKGFHIDTASLCDCISDHTPIHVDLDLVVDSADIDMSKPDGRISQKSIRKAIREVSVQDLIKDNDFETIAPLSKVLEPILPKGKKIGNWCGTTPLWFLLKGKGSTWNWHVAKKEEWGKFMKLIEEANKAGDSREMFKLVKRATAYKKKGVPIQGISKGSVKIVDKEEVKEVVSEFYEKLYDDP